MPPARAHDEEAAYLEPYGLATRLDPSSYKAWHAWALVNYRAVQRAAAEARGGRGSGTLANPSNATKNRFPNGQSKAHAIALLKPRIVLESPA